MQIGSRVSLGLTLGATGGALGWLLTDFIFNPPSDPERMLNNPNPVTNALLGGFIGLFIGLGLGMADGFSARSRTRFTRSTIRGALSGFLGGAVGMQMGNLVFTLLGGDPQLGNKGMGAFLYQALARGGGWLFLGAVLGGLYGLLDTGATKGRNGLIGGSIGGFLAGVVFNPLAYVIAQTVTFIQPADRMSRLVSYVLLGGFIGFFTALVQAILKAAWVLVVYARNEGREIELYPGVSHIGRSELAEIPIFRDGLVAANHAEIFVHDNRYFVRDNGSVVGTSVNGQRVTDPVMLKDSDLIQVGNTQVIFYERATAGAVRRQVDLSKAAPAAPPLTPTGACAFCGQQKDPATGACACTVSPAAGAAPGSASAFPPSPSPFAPQASQAAFPVADAQPFGGGMGAPAAGFGTPVGGGFPAPPLAGYDPNSATVGIPGSAPPFGASGSAGQLRLVCLSGPHAGQVYPLGPGAVRLGRDAGSGIPLVQDTTVSRSHASLQLDGSGVVQVQDLGSSNGTFVNGARVTSSEVRPGDELSFGTARFRLEA